MPGAENDVAVLVRLKEAREASIAAREARTAQPVDRVTSREMIARSRWPACVAILKSLAVQYQQRSADLGIRFEVEEVVRLRSWIPDVVVHVGRNDGGLATDLQFKMASDGRTTCTIRQTRGRRQGNLNREERPVDMSERHLRELLRAVVQILIVR